MVAPASSVRALERPARALLRTIARRLRRAYGAPPDPRRLAPLDELILTILSQNTNDTNRDRAYEDLRRRFRTWDEVADAPIGAISHAIRRGGLGPTKAPRIRSVLRTLRDEGIRLDRSALAREAPAALWQRLIALPGVGPKTAACVLLFSRGEPYFPVDTHVHRLAIRLGLVSARSTASAAQAAMQQAVPSDLVYELHMDLIRHGRHVCVAQRPICSECVLRDLCPRVGVKASR